MCYVFARNGIGTRLLSNINILIHTADNCRFFRIHLTASVICTLWFHSGLWTSKMSLALERFTCYHKRAVSSMKELR